MKTSKVRCQPQKGKSVSSIVRCIICYMRVDDSSTDDLCPEISSGQLLLALSKALRVSDTIYANADISALPSIPFCSNCNFLIYDAVRILKEIKKLEVNWSCIVNVLKDNLSASNRRYSSRPGKGIKCSNQVMNMELIRKTLLQCFTTCSVDISSEDVQINTLESPAQEIQVESLIKLEPQDASDFDFSEMKLDMNNDENQEDMMSEAEEMFNNLELEFGDIDGKNNVNTQSSFENFKDDQQLPGGSDTDTKRIQMNSKGKTDTIFCKNTRRCRTLNILKCKFCPKAYLRKTYLEAHELQHKGKLDVDCQKCNRSFVSVRSLRLHQSMQRQCHLSKTESSSSLPLKSKQKNCIMKITHTATSSRTLYKHSLTSFKCQQCKQNFNKEDYRHDSGYYIFKCTIHGCDKSFYNFSLFRRHHERTCPQKTGKGFSCHYCDRSFANSSNLKAHEIALHTKQFKYICEECGHGAVTPSHLKKHMLVHTDEKAFKCHLCPKAFKRNVQLVFHVRRHNNELPFLCGTCGKRFVNLQHLQNHETIHLQTKNVPCPICNKLFINKGYVRNHIYSFHSKSRKPR